MDISVILPVYNEEKTIGKCIDKIKENFPSSEIIVVDNNSTDNSIRIAREKNVRILFEPKQGYGAALRRGFEDAKGDYIVMADADNTYDFKELPKLLNHKGFDFIIGNRLNFRQKKGSMPFLHKHIGTPVLTKMLNTIFRSNIKDSQCGFRMIKKEALSAMNLQSTGMELASEMIIKAQKLKLKIKEVNITYHPRQGESKLNTFRDGWRHFRLIMIYGPSYLFLLPGLILFFLGFVMLYLLSVKNLAIFGIVFQTHPMLLGSMLTVLGYNIMLLWVFTKIYEREYLNERNEFVDFINKYLNLEKILITSIIIIFVGAAIFGNILFEWIQADFGEINMIRQGLLALTIVILGMQTIFAGFFMSILGMKNSNNNK